jgi:hypothetical protein
LHYNCDAIIFKDFIMRTATLPAVRTTPETRQLIESVLREGETLSTFIEETARKHAQWRKEDDAFYARALAASKRIDAGGKTYTLDEVMASLRAMTQKKKQELAAKNESASKVV